MSEQRIERDPDGLRGCYWKSDGVNVFWSGNHETFGDDATWRRYPEEGSGGLLPWPSKARIALWHSLVSQPLTVPYSGAPADAVGDEGRKVMDLVMRYAQLTVKRCDYREGDEPNELIAGQAIVYRELCEAVESLASRRLTAGGESDSGSPQPAASGERPGYPAAARSIALNLEPFCDPNLPFSNMIAEAARRARKRIELLLAEREEIIKALGIEWDDIPPGWWVPAEPRPVMVESVPDAIRKTLEIGTADHTRLTKELDALRTKAAGRVAGDGFPSDADLLSHVYQLRTTNTNLPAPLDGRSLLANMYVGERDRHRAWHRKEGVPCSGMPDDPYCRAADEDIAEQLRGANGDAPKDLAIPSHPREAGGRNDG